MKKIGTIYDRFDLFSKTFPTFNLEGHSRFGTCVGFILSIVLITLVMAYSCIRGLVLVSGSRPNISSVNMRNERLGNELIDLNTFNF